MKKIKAFAVVDGTIDRYWEQAEMCFYATFPYKKMAERYNKIVSDGLQKVVPVTITLPSIKRKKK